MPALGASVPDLVKLRQLFKLAEFFLPSGDPPRWEEDLES